MFTVITDVYKSIHAAVNKGSQCFYPVCCDSYFNFLIFQLSVYAEVVTNIWKKNVVIQLCTSSPPNKVLEWWEINALFFVLKWKYVVNHGAGGFFTDTRVLCDTLFLQPCYNKIWG